MNSPSKPEFSLLSGTYGWNNRLEEVVYGPGSLTTALPRLMQDMSAKKALVVTGRSLYYQSTVISRVESILKDVGAYGATFFEIGQHAPVADIRRGMALFIESGCDLIVSVGGGSPIDASKAILHNVSQTTGCPIYRQIAIPTTLSAAEYTIGAGYTSSEGQKVGINSPLLAPSGVILDAELTLDTPEELWLSTGIRALDHAIENLYRPRGSTLPIQTLYYAAIVDLFKFLPESKANPRDLNIRQRLQVASCMSLWPTRMRDGEHSSLGLSHSLGHKLGATYGIPHGITSCLTLSPVVALQAEILSLDKKEILARVIYHLRHESTGSDVDDIKLLSRLIANLVENLGLQTTLSKYNIPEGDLSSIAGRVIGYEDAELYEKIVQVLRDLY